MASKKVTKLKIPVSINPASSFIASASESAHENIESDINKDADSKAEATSKEEKLRGKPGRPRKPNKRQQYTLTMDPKLYGSLKKYAENHQLSFSQLITNAAIEYIDTHK
jgi:hypothetical protein